MAHTYNVLPVGKKIPEIAPSPWDCNKPPENDWGTAIGNMHKNMVKIAHVIREIYLWTDRETGT